MSKQKQIQPDLKATELAAGSSPSAERRSSGTKVGFFEAEAQREAFLARLVRMSAEERRRAARYGGFTSWQRALWAARFPKEVPVVNGEYEWIAVNAE
jgi:hypothetical protein